MTFKLTKDCVQGTVFISKPRIVSLLMFIAFALFFFSGFFVRLNFEMIEEESQKVASSVQTGFRGNSRDSGVTVYNMRDVTSTAIRTAREAINPAPPEQVPSALVVPLHKHCWSSVELPAKQEAPLTHTPLVVDATQNPSRAAKQLPRPFAE